MTSESVDHTGSGVPTATGLPVPRGPEMMEYVSAIHTKGGDKGKVPN